MFINSSHIGVSTYEPIITNHAISRMNATNMATGTYVGVDFNTTGIIWLPGI